MKRLFIILSLLGAIFISGCQEDLPSPTSSEEEKGNNDSDKESGDKEEEAQKVVVVNGTVINEATNLYGLVKNTQSGKGIPGIVVSDGFVCVQTDNNGVYQIERNENCEIVNVSIPAEYEIPVDGGNQPAFYKRFTVAKDAKFRYDFTLTPLAGGKQSEFTLLTLADIQLHDSQDADRFRDETMPDIDKLVPSLVNPIAVTLGDDTNKNNSGMWAKIKQTTANHKVTIFHCMGNHDHLNELTPNDHSQATTYWKSVENFHKYFGPQNYSLSRSDTHIVVMDNALHGETPPDGDYEYAAGFFDWQFEWLKQDLSYVPKDKMVLLCLHIPFRDGNGGNHSDARYRKKVLQLLSEYKEAHLLIGHTHKQINWIHTVNGKKIYEHIHGAVCGGMWHSTFCVDGTPNGYGVYHIKGNTLNDWYYKATGYEPEMQMRVYDGSQVFYDPRLSANKTAKQNFFSSYTWGYSSGNIVANIWNLEHGDWDVTIWQNGKQVATMSKLSAREWWVAYWFLEVYGTTNDSYQGSTKHLYKGKLADRSAPFTVRAVDKSGKRKTMECSTLTTDFSEVWGDFDTMDVARNPIPASEQEW